MIQRVAVGVWHVDSETMRNRVHTVKREGMGFRCSCHAYKINKIQPCKHIQEVLHEINARPYVKMGKIGGMNYG